MTLFIFLSIRMHALIERIPLFVKKIRFLSDYLGNRPLLQILYFLQIKPGLYVAEKILPSSIAGLRFKYDRFCTNE